MLAFLSTFSIALAILIMLLCAWSGLTRGFVVSSLDIVILGIAIFVGVLVFESPSATDLTPVGLSATAAARVGFVACAVAGEVIRSVVTRATYPTRLAVVTGRATLDYVDRLAGIVPGLLRGGLYVLVGGILIIGATVTTAESSPSGVTQLLALATDVVVGAPISASILSPSGLTGTEVSAISTTGLVTSSTSLAVVPTVSSSVEDQDAEGQLFRMVNLERVRYGSSALVLDENLNGLALQHSQEMLRLAYFAHQSPSNGNLQSRYRGAGLPYRTIGENLAYAPSVDAAFAGLVASPPHLQNILSADFHRVGIGIARAPASWIMVTQDFAG